MVAWKLESGRCLGDGKIKGNGGGQHVSGESECQDLCDSEPTCTAFEYSVSQRRCRVGTCSDYANHSPLEDYFLKVKPQADIAPKSQSAKFDHEQFCAAQIGKTTYDFKCNTWCNELANLAAGEKREQTCHDIKVGASKFWMKDIVIPRYGLECPSFVNKDNGEGYWDIHRRLHYTFQAFKVPNVFPTQQWIQGEKGEDCYKVCGRRGMVCDPEKQSQLTNFWTLAVAHREAGYECKKFKDPESYEGVPSSKGNGQCIPIEEGAKSKCEGTHGDQRSLCYCSHVDGMTGENIASKYDSEVIRVMKTFPPESLGFKGWNDMPDFSFKCCTNPISDRRFCDKAAFEFCKKYPNYAPCTCLTRNPSNKHGRDLSDQLPKQCYWEQCKNPSARFERTRKPFTCTGLDVLNDLAQDIDTSESVEEQVKHIAETCAETLGCGGFSFLPVLYEKGTDGHKVCDTDGFTTHAGHRCEGENLGDRFEDVDLDTCKAACENEEKCVAFQHTSKGNECVLKAACNLRGSKMETSYLRVPKQPCLDEDRKYATLDVAMNACYLNPDCDLVQQTGSDFYLRRQEDPDDTTAEGTLFKRTKDHVKPLKMKAISDCKSSSSCLLNNTPFSSLPEAIEACNRVPNCEFVEKNDNRFYLRRKRDFVPNGMNSDAPLSVVYSANRSDKRVFYCTHDTFSRIGSDNDHLVGSVYRQHLSGDDTDDESEEEIIEKKSKQSKSLLELVKDAKEMLTYTGLKNAFFDSHAPPLSEKSLTPDTIEAKVKKPPILTSLVSAAHCPSNAEICSINNVTVSTGDCEGDSCVNLDQKCGNDEKPSDYIDGKGKYGNQMGVQCSADHGASSPCCGQKLERELEEDEKCQQSRPICLGFVAGKSWGTCVGEANLLAPFPKMSFGKGCLKGKCLDGTAYTAQDAIRACQKNKNCAYIAKIDNQWYLRRHTDPQCRKDETKLEDTCTALNINDVGWCSKAQAWGDSSWGCCLQNDKRECPSGRAFDVLHEYPRCKGGDTCAVDMEVYKLKDVKEKASLVSRMFGSFKKTTKTKMSDSNSHIDTDPDSDPDPNADPDPCSDSWIWEGIQPLVFKDDKCQVKVTTREPDMLRILGKTPKDGRATAAVPREERNYSRGPYYVYLSKSQPCVKQTKSQIISLGKAMNVHCNPKLQKG